MPKRIHIVAKGELSTYQTQEMQLVSPAALERERQVAPDYAPARYNSHSVAPEVAIPRHCTRKGAKKLRPCHIELLFVGDELGAKFNVAPGAYLMACAKWAQPGALIPVRDHAHATRVSANFCSCRTANRPAGACATEAQEQALLGRHRRRR